MGIAYTDSLGPVVDTGCNTQPSVRPSVDTEIHTAQELETGSKLALTAIAASHVQHRPAGHPR